MSKKPKRSVIPSEAKNLPLFKNKPILTIIILFLALVVLAIILWLFDLQKTAKIDILVSPKSSQIKIGGQSFKNGTHRLQPGTYTVTISREGFQPYSTTITAKANDTEYIHLCLTPEESHQNWYTEHEADDIICTSIGDREADQKALDTLAKYPILKTLPYTTKFYRIDVNFTDSEDPSLSIFINTCAPSAFETYKKEALTWLQSQNIPPENYRITYSTLCN